MSFVFLGLATFSLWIRRERIVWGTLLILTILFGYLNGLIEPIGVAILAGWTALCFFHKPKNISLFLLLIALSFGFKFHLFPGFHAIPITPKFYLGLDVPVMEFLPLALFVPLARTAKDWKGVIRGIAFGIIGIAFLAVLAILAKATHLHYKLPSHAPLRFAVNFLFTAVLEEGFYRGFIQRQLSDYFRFKGGKIWALLIASLIFTFAHIYWSPSIDILAFVLLASLLYGGVYLISGKIESAIATHFLLNFVHMTFFTYHAM